MNILLIYTYNPGLVSGVIATDLFKELQKQGHNVKLLVNRYDPSYPEGIVSMETYFLFWKKKILDKIKNKLRLNRKQHTDPKYHFLDLSEQKEYYKTTKILKKANLKPDAIIVLFAKYFINSKNIYELYKKTNAPVYWLMYDMAPLTGGCHYAWECKGYQNNCGNCPGLFSTDPFDITFENLQFKKKYLDRTDIRMVTGSEWQYRQAKESTLFKNYHIHKILTAFNTDIFKPVAKEVIRKKNGIPKEKKIVFFGAHQLFDERKGMKYLLDSFKILKDLLRTNPELNNNILLLIAGNGFDKIKDHLPFEYHNMGMLDNSHGIASAYQAADIFVCPSIEDSGPSMINQSIMCGTPVVCFNMGVALDLVFNGKTGYRSKLRDSKDLAQGMYNILSMPSCEYEIMQNNCRQLALDFFQPAVNINNWLKILNSTDDKRSNSTV